MRGSFRTHPYCCTNVDLKGGISPCRMAAGAARGLHYLHSELGLVHADVKPENMLMTRDKVIKIADFGLSGEYCGQALGQKGVAVCTHT